MPAPTAPRLAFVEPLCVGLEHAPINAALVAALVATSPGALDVYAEASHLDAIRDILALTRPAAAAAVDRWCPIDVPDRKARGWKRFNGTRRLFRELDTALAASGSHAVLFSTSDVAVLACAKRRLLGSWGSRQVVAVFHELLASLERRQSRRRFALTAALGPPHPSPLRYVVLSEAIRAHLDGIARRLSSHVVAIEHPSLLGDVPLSRPLHVPPPVRFGFVGGGREAKGLLQFVELARAVRARHPDAEFHIVGSVSPNVPDEQLAGLVYSRTRLPLQDYVQRIRDLSHVVWLGDVDHYRLVASGSLADVVAIGVPVICQAAPFAERLFRQFGEIGWLCQSLEEVQDTVMQIASDWSAGGDREQRERLAAARATLAPETWAHVLAEALVRRRAP